MLSSGKIVCLGIFLFYGLVHAESLDSKLQRFYQDPKAGLAERIQKFDDHNQPVSARHPLLADVDDEWVSVVKSRERLPIVGPPPRPLTKLPSEPGPRDRAENLLSRANLLNDPIVMHIKGLDAANLPESPWSGDYWAIYKGILGHRFRDPQFPWVQDWAKLFEYVQRFPFLDIFKSGDSAKIDELAASEKYDLIMGDLQGTLTQNMWGQGKEYYDAYGKVENWMGICHGWSAAAVAVPRPQQTIQIPTYDGKTTVSLNPSEIKGLISYLWATTPYNTAFIGGRCNLKEVPKDDLGRPIAPECNDTNPGTWHLSIVNAIGIEKRGFVMDVTTDYEVWNQPVYGYSISYFNPKNQKQVVDPQDGIVNLSNWSEDPFRKYRSKKAVQVLGVSMDVKYVVEESANERSTDSADYDTIFTATYLYDLELDERGKIVGGEWMNHQHPDFLWIPLKGAKPINYEDTQITSHWNAEGTTPPDWREAATWASQGGRVLSKVMDILSSKSRASE